MRAGLPGAAMVAPGRAAVAPGVSAPAAFGVAPAVILAVLERRVGVKLHAKDVYVSTVGGVRLHEPAADLAIALAVISADADQPLPHDLAAIGELSLAGEIRPVVGGPQRASEARRLGYSRLIDAEASSLRRARELALGKAG